MPPNASTFAEFAQRCAEYGVAVWIRDGDARIAPPVSAELAALFGTSVLARLIDEPLDVGAAPREIATGLWASEVPLPPGGRSARALFASPDFLECPQFADASREAGLSIWRSRQIAMPFARFDARAAKVASSMLPGVAGDHSELREHKKSLESFTRELTDSYETINVLYSIGRSMFRQDDPQIFVRGACEKLQQSTDLGWVAALLPSQGATQPWTLLSAGDAARPLDLVRRAPELAALAGGSDGKRVILPAQNGLCRNTHSQCLVQPVTQEGELLALMVAGDKSGRDLDLSSYEIQLVEAAARYISTFLSNCKLFEAQRRTFVGTLRAITAAIDAKDRYTRGHSERVAWLSRALAVHLGVAPAPAERIHISGLVHDVGKIGVPESVLCKPGKLTDEEFAYVRRHPEIGHAILIGIPEMADVLPGVLHHHERWDGRGYPHKLVGEASPFQARIIAVADTFDAMSSTRSYRSARARDVVLAEIARCAGAQLDPEVAQAALEMDLGGYDRLLAEHALNDQSSQAA